MSRFQTLTPPRCPARPSSKPSPTSTNTPWVAEKAYDLGIDDSLNDIEGLHQRMADILLSASREAQLALINAHPDLAGKAAIRGELTASSTSEQAGAGIHECSAEEFARFTELNDAYKARFGFPSSRR